MAAVSGVRVLSRLRLRWMAGVKMALGCSGMTVEGT